MNNETEALLDSLRLHGIKNRLDEVLLDAQREGTAIEDVLLNLLKEEYRYKQERSTDNRVRNAKLPWSWSMQSFPFEQQPAVNKTQIMGLAKLNFIKNNENIVFIGKPGTGKTGLTIGLLRLAALNGYRCRFYNAQVLLDELNI